MLIHVGPNNAGPCVREFYILRIECEVTTQQAGHNPAILLTISSAVALVGKSEGQGRHNVDVFTL